MSWRSVLQFFIVLIIFLLSGTELMAQCSICTKTAQQLGEGPAKGLNAGIIYLAFIPLALIGVISFRWWQRNKDAW